MSLIRWIDFSGARPGARAIKAAGAEGVLRYISANVPSTAWKRATKTELQSYLSAGIDVILNFEWYEGRMLEGARAGAIDGKTALSAAKSLGYPKGATIYFSHDTSARNDTAVKAYLKAAETAMLGYYEVDIYSGYYVVEMALSAGRARYGWQTLAWSNGKIGRAHLYQNGKMWFAKGADEDVVLRKPLGSWLETLIARTPVNKPTPKPVPKPVPKPPKKPIKQIVTYHKIKQGESLSVIASHYKTTVAQLIAWNRKKYPSLATNPNLIKAGWVLQTTAGTSSAPKPAPKPVPKPPVKKPVPKPPAKKPVTYHTVKSGETLSAIASHYHTTVRQLQAWNKVIKNPNVIYPGWRLRVK